MENVNIFSIVLAIFTPLAVYLLIYENPLLAKLKSNVETKKEKKQSRTIQFIQVGVVLVVSFFLAFFMLRFCNDIGQEGQYDNFGHGAWHGAFIGVFIVLPVVAINGWQERKNWRPILANVLYWLVTLALMGGIVDAMNHFPNT